MLRINRQSTAVKEGINNTLRAAGGLGGINPFRNLVYNIERAVILAGAPSSVKYASFSESVRSIGSGNRPASQRETYDVVSDLVAKGTEIELIANPTPNWRLSASFARNDAVESNVRNLFDNVERRAQATTSTGDVAVFTIPEKRTFILTNTFSF